MEKVRTRVPGAIDSCKGGQITFYTMEGGYDTID
uniref:Uncharacterized protein n=1 Tax=Rhizophora mucronata TaxID=61149 RepID=A0A2P2QM99_RHIMU